MNIKLSREKFNEIKTMSDYCSKKDFDQLSSFTFKSQISNYEFHSPLPLPQNPERIPTNDVSPIL